MSAPAPVDSQGLARQHLIDPEICIRCNTCEELCPPKAILHDRGTYAVDFDRCDGCGLCLPPCPTGAIDSWRKVLRPYPTAEQILWDSLPADSAPAPAVAVELPAEVAVLSAAAGGEAAARPPWSAAHPYVNLYPPTRPALATVTGNYRLTAADAGSDIHHIVLDFGKTAFPVLEGQSVGVAPPGVDAEGRPHHVRLYSVASPRDGERPGYNNLALTVKRVTEDRAGRPLRGVASNYLCDLRKGDTVPVSGPYGSTFLMPNHPGSSLLMVCTGTGAAPMRAMTERRRRRIGRGEGGRLVLFFGARTPGELPYFGPLMKLPRDFIDVNLVFSRQPDRERASTAVGEPPRRHVQDLLRARAADVAALLRDPDCFVYVCGHKEMGVGVEAALAEICQRHGLDLQRLLPELRAQGRYHCETY